MSQSILQSPIRGSRTVQHTTVVIGISWAVTSLTLASLFSLFRTIAKLHHRGPEGQE